MARVRLTAIGLLALAGVLAWAVVASGTQPYETYEATIASEGPVAQFRFSDPSGSKTIADTATSAGTYTATNTGITLGGVGPFGGSKSGSFTGKAEATLPSDPLAGATAFTAEAWVDRTGGSSFNQPIFDFGSSTTNYLYLTPASSLTKNTMLFEIRNTAGTVFQVTAPELTSKAWEYIAVSETSSGTLTLYLNGAQVGQTAGATLTPSSLGSLPTDYLGKSLISAEPQFNGSMSNVAFYTKALSASQILAHYNAAEFPVNTAVPTISGTAKDGSTLTATSGTWSGLAPITFKYQWTRCNTSGAECASIASATETKYKAGHEDVGKTLRVAVTATNSAGSGTATSAQTAAVAALAPTNTARPAISGSAKVGQLLSVSNGSWEGTPPFTYAYEWETCNAKGESCKAISGATASSYRVISPQVGDTLRAIVTAANSAGKASATSAATATVTTGSPVNTALPAISGALKEGQTLTAATGTWAGTEPISYAYQWQSCNGKGESCANISGATSSTYALTSSNVGTTLDVVVTAKNSVGSTAATSLTTAVVPATAPSNTARPTISGEAKERQTLSASTGEWAGTPPFTYTYQWQSCNSLGEGCLNVTGATSSTYTLGPSDVGTTLRVAVTATNSAGAASGTSEATPVVFTPQQCSPAKPAASAIAVTSNSIGTLKVSWEIGTTLPIREWIMYWSETQSLQTYAAEPALEDGEARSAELKNLHPGEPYTVVLALEYGSCVEDRVEEGNDAGSGWSLAPAVYFYNDLSTEGFAGPGERFSEGNEVTANFGTWGRQSFTDLQTVEGTTTNFVRCGALDSDWTFENGKAGASATWKIDNWEASECSQKGYCAAEEAVGLNSHRCRLSVTPTKRITATASRT